jgi:hypothetical protein
MNRLVILLVLLSGICLLAAQANIFNQDANKPAGSAASSIFNPYKLKISHSMGFTAGSSSTGLGFYESRYTNHLQYEFNPKLNLELDLNFVNYGSAISGKGFSFQANDDNKTRLIPEFSLKYKPSDSVVFELGYKSYHSDLPWLGHSLSWLE